MKDLKPSQLALELRSARYKKIKNHYDLLVIGAGVHGSLLSWIAAKYGYSVLIIDAADYGQGTSSRSSKLLHGGVRYLEQANFSLVYKSLCERREFMKMAPHLTRSLPFLYAVQKEKTPPAWLVKFGLSLYESAARFWGQDSAREYVEFEENLRKLGLKADSLVPYHDGQINDVRFCVEAICEANKLGADTFNYLKFSKASMHDQKWQVELEDRVTTDKLNISCEKIANLSGAGVKDVHLNCFAHWSSAWPKITYSTGVHLFFDLDLPDIGLIMPAESRGRYYFMLPVFSPYRKGVLVGTTDRKVEKPECFPKPTEEEVNQIHSLIRRDLPNLDQSKLYHSISGTRVLAGSSDNSFSLSRDEKILTEKNYACLLGGKYTTARSTAYEILENLFGKKFSKLDLILSGSKSYVESDHKDLELNAAFNRFGNNALDLLKLSSEQYFNWQINYCIKNEQAVYWSDIFSRRLNLDYMPPSLNSVNSFKDYNSL